jgi:hypothetical protein
MPQTSHVQPMDGRAEHQGEGRHARKQPIFYSEDGMYSDKTSSHRRKPAPGDFPIEAVKKKDSVWEVCLSAHLKDIARMHAAESGGGQDPRRSQAA